MFEYVVGFRVVFAIPSYYYGLRLPCVCATSFLAIQSHPRTILSSECLSRSFVFLFQGGSFRLPGVVDFMDRVR